MCLELVCEKPANWWDLVFKIQGDFLETRYFMATTLLYQFFPFFKQIQKDFSGTKLQLLPVLSRLTSCIACDCVALAPFFGIWSKTECTSYHESNKRHTASLMTCDLLRNACKDIIQNTNLLEIKHCNYIFTYIHYFTCFIVNQIKHPALVMIALCR